MNIKVFGQLTDIFNQENISIGKVANMEDLKNHLVKAYPALAEKTYVVAVNRKVIHENILLDENAEIALLPPFSGG